MGMKLFDGSGEYVRVADLKQGDTVRSHGDHVDREVLTIHPGPVVGVVCTDGYGWEAPAESQIIRRYPKS